MEQQFCMKDFIRYTMLSVLGTLGVSCYILADTFFVSKGLGTKGLTALNLAIPVYNFIHGTGLMLGMGGATKFTICRSRKDVRGGSEIYTSTIWLAVFFSILFFLSGILFSGRLTALLGADVDVFAMTDIYLRWLLVFAPAFIMNDVQLCFVRNDNVPGLSMAAMLIGSFSNILLDYIFIFPMNMGIFGAILATGVSPVISMAMMLPHWLRKKNTFHFIKAGIRMDIVKQDLSLGFPSFLAQLSSGIVMITFNGLILGITGNVGVAAYGIVANISLVIVAVYTGIAQGVQPLISQFYGVGNDKSVRTVLRYAMVTMCVMAFIVYLFIFIFARPITAVFNSENNYELQQIAVNGLRLFFISTPFVGYNIILANFFTSVERALPAQILSLIRGLVLMIPMAFIMAALWKMSGVWLAYPVTEGFTMLLGIVIDKNNKKCTFTQDSTV